MAGFSNSHGMLVCSRADLPTVGAVGVDTLALFRCFQRKTTQLVSFNAGLLDFGFVSGRFPAGSPVVEHFSHSRQHIHIPPFASGLLLFDTAFRASSYQLILKENLLIHFRKVVHICSCHVFISISISI